MLEAARAIEESIAKTFTCIGLNWEDDVLVVGLMDSLDKSEIQSLTKEITSRTGFKVKHALVPEALLREVIEISYSQVSGVDFSAPAKFKGNSEGPIAELVNNVLDRAVRMRASDVHIEPTEEDLVIRIRVDGLLEEMTRLPGAAAASFVSRLKVLSRLDIVERRRPQDGQFSITLATRKIDVRLATVATLYGEKIVLRLLDTKKQMVGLSELGMSDNNLEKFQRLINSQHGLVITAGPTGSGKTTTLHSAVKTLNSPFRNVSTLEDPVEYVVPGVNHITVNESIGTGFSVQLRAILRQDPDVVLVGEMRDSETARIGVQAALAGRLVLTSLHATDVVGVIYRLFQMGIEPYLVAASLRGVVAQRLIRRCCAFCSEEAEMNAADKLLLNHYTKETRKIQVKYGAGCTICRGTGFLDRVGAYQIFEISDEMRELISTRPNPSEIYELAEEEGLRTLADEAFDLVLAGKTTLSEASSVIGTDV